MALTQVTGPYPIFTDLDGSPLDDGYLYIGTANQDPQTNPIQVYWDSALTIPATQPIRTNNGYAWRNGTPALLYTDEQFSITIRNKKNEFVLYSPVGYGFINTAATKNDYVGNGVQTDFGLSASPSTILATNVFINGVYQEKDSYTLSGNTISFSSAPPLSSSIEVITQETVPLGTTSADLVSYTSPGAGAISQTVADKLDQTISVKDFGAVGDGVTDDTVAIQLALNSGASSVFLPDGKYYCADNIVVPSGVTLYGSAQPIASDASFGGAQLDFANNVSVCVTVGTVTLGTSGLRNISVTRQGSAPTANATAIRVVNQQNTILDNIYVNNHDIGYSFNGGLGLFVSRLFSGKISGTHWLINGVPELRAEQCRLGTNGPIDVNANEYVRIVGGGSGSGSGPNTLIFESCQFNVGGGAVVDCLFNIKEITRTGGVVSFIELNGCYAENFNTGFRTDSTVLSFRRLIMTATVFSATSGLTSPDILDLDPATRVNEWNFVGCQFYGNSFNTSGNVINSMSLTGNRFGLPVSIDTGTTLNNTAVLSGNTYLDGGLTISGANGWANLIVNDVFQLGSSLTCTAGPPRNVRISTPAQTPLTWVPGLSFDNQNTGVTYSVQSGAYNMVGNMVTVQFRIILTSKGSATGIARITGLPVVGNPNSYQTGGGGLVVQSNALSGISAPIILRGPSSLSTNLSVLQQNATATSSLTDANFTNTTEISGFATYFV